MPASNWQENYIPEPNSGCWIWLGAVSNWGYGVVYPLGRRGKQHRAHRLIYELHRGPIPNDLLACHKCDNTQCVNPDHIFLGTHSENAQDRSKKGRNADQKGEKGNNSRLDWSDVKAIRASNLSNKALATLFSVNASQISRIRSGKRW